MEQLILTAAKELLVLLIMLMIILVGVITRFLAERLGTEKLKRSQVEWEAMTEPAMAAVKFAEQAYRAFSDRVKKEQALAFLSRELTRRGIRVSDEALSDLIEAALREIKDTWGDDWGTRARKESS